MLHRTRIILSTLAILSGASSISAQGPLTAKNNKFQPQPVSTLIENDRIRDGLVGPVRRVRTETVKLTNVGGRLVEGKRALLEVVSYDVRGRKVENQYFPADGATLTGKEVYNYDDKGNISEMTLVGDDGSLLSKENYKYEFDFAGNWNKMTTSVAVVDTGKVNFEPTEVTYRSIMYYLDANMVKMVQPKPQPSSQLASVKPPTDSAPVVLPKESANDQKAELAPSVSAGTLDKVNVSNSVELRTIPTGAETKGPQIVLDLEPPPASAPRQILKPVSGGVLNGSALSLPSPVYPELARRMRLAGTVLVDVVIDEVGKVISARCSSGPTGLREAAIQAALRARFSPTKLSGQPVKVSGVINYKFSLTP